VKRLIMITALLLTQACAPQESDQAPAPASSVASAPALGTRDIVANREFDFKVDRAIDLMLTNSHPVRGGVHVYRRLVEGLDAGQIMPDPSSMIMSLNLRDSISLELRVNDNWEFLVVEWIPQSSTAQNEVHLLRLDESQQSYQLLL
jgi:hypothetical protein